MGIATVSGALILPALGYVMLYLAAPGRQTQSPPRGARLFLRLGGTVVSLVGAGLAVGSLGWGLGLTVAVTASMAAASAVVVVAPLFQSAPASGRRGRVGADRPGDAR